MSLHAELTPEAIERLRQEKRRATVSSIISSLLFILIIGITLGIFLLPNLSKDEVQIITYGNPNAHKEELQQTKVTTNIQRKPSAPSSSQVRTIAVNTSSNVSIPVPEISDETPSVDFGTGDDFGTGWGGTGSGTGQGSGGGMFGSSNSIPGALVGRLYDLKQNRRGRETNFDTGVESYASVAQTVERRKFAFSAFSKYFEAPNELSLTNLAIPFTDADKGPEYFGAKEEVEPSGWIAAYHGRLVAPESGRYRFRGAADDYMVALVNGQRNLVACWEDLHGPVAGRFKSGVQTGNTQSPLGAAKLHAGKWITLKAGQPFDLSLAIGERPGGQVGFILEIEKEGETYRTTPNGRKILPLFTTHPFSEKEINEIKDRFPNYEFEWEKVPVFGKQ